MRTISSALRAAILCGFLPMSLPVASQGNETVPDVGLEDLVNTEVVSASRRAQSLQRVAAAVFVITQEDIVRSGARRLADVLAMAPGLEVARIGNNRWAVSARGGNGRFANKLQVLKDGRSVYSPLFSGVFWEAEDTVLEDIERIEIIRGPNAAMWGSNAVNGTINIISRKARDTQGGLVAATAGSEDRHNLSARYGIALGDAGHLRVYGKSLDRRAGFKSDGSRATDWGEAGMAGFRADWLLSSGNRLLLNGETYRDRNADTYNFADPTAPNNIGVVNSVMTLTGSHLHGRYESLSDDGSEVVAQSYFTRRTLDAQHVLREERDTFDLDVQYRLAPRGSHDLMIGANYRSSTDTTTSPPGSYVTFASRSRDFHLGSIFVNDEIAVVKNRFSVTLGARLENNNYSGTDLQPTARFAWTPDVQRTIWGAVSRATRTPSRAEGSATMPLAVTGSAPEVLSSFRNTTEARQDSEKMDALELGYRQRYSAALSLDATAFAHRYRDGLTSTMLGVDMSHIADGYVIQPSNNVNGARARLNGVELAAFIQLTPDWRLQPSYTWMMVRAFGIGNAQSDANARKTEKKLPRQQLSLRSQHNLGRADRLDFWFKYKTRNEDLGIPARGNLDIRYAWKASRELELSLVGQNLLHRRTLEYLPDSLPSATVETGRSAHLRAEYRF